MKKILIGGSPCTWWSCAKTSSQREVLPQGIGWELFLNFVIAKEKFKPDYFLYENNKSISEPIKQQISRELDCDYIMINSALVSAQSRKRCYWHNIPDVTQPDDRNILLRDILESGITDSLKSYCLTASYSGAVISNTLSRKQRSMVYSPVLIGDIGSRSQGYRVYSCNGKSVAICSRGGGLGSIAGLYLCPADMNGSNVYHIKDNIINVNGTLYEINLPDGYYAVRKLSVTECCRLQTLPDDYCRVVSNSQAYKGLGNGWTAEVVIHILNYMNIPKDEEVVVLSMYDGIGTGRYCFDRLGYTNLRYYAYEIDKYAVSVSMSNYPDIFQCGNAFSVRECDWKLEN